MNSLKVLIKLYQKCLSPYLPYRCRYSPSCSDYFIHALEKKGILLGSLLTGVRIMKCNPFFPGGYDPVR